MTIYAKQVPPEYQESPLFWNDDVNAEIFGNRDYKRITSELFDRLPAALEDLSCVWDNIRNGEYNAASWADELRDLVPPQGRPDYTREERRDAWPNLLKQYESSSSLYTNSIYCTALHLITGRAWDCCTLRGNCQGDWQYCIYPADDWDGASLERLEAEYFNTGSEWIVHDSPDAPDGPEDIDGFSVYCVGWNNDQIRQEIADAAGGQADEVQLYQFCGFRRVAEYLEA